MKICEGELTLCGVSGVGTGNRPRQGNLPYTNDVIKIPPTDEDRVHGEWSPVLVQFPSTCQILSRRAARFTFVPMVAADFVGLFDVVRCLNSTVAWGLLL